MRIRTQQIYVNPKQKSVLEQILTGLFNIIVGICGRGFGKTTLLAILIFEFVRAHPRGRAALVGPEIKGLKNRIWPGIQGKLEAMGLQEDIHFVVGKAPPKNWVKAYSPPKDPKSCVFFVNGVVLDMVGMKNKTSGRGPSYDALFGDEFLHVDQEKFEGQVVPAVRGSHHRRSKIPCEWHRPKWGKVINEKGKYFWVFAWKDSPFFQLIALFSSMPSYTNPWIYEEYKNAEAKEIEGYKFSPLYFEGTWRDNLAVLGEYYYGQQKMRIRLKRMFDIEIDNKPPVKRGKKFYSRFNASKHVLLTDPYDEKRMLYLSWDFGSFTSLVVLQYDREKKIIYAIREYFSYEGLVSQCLALFEAEFQDHQERLIVMSGDVNGLFTRSPKNNTTNLFQEAETTLRALKWRVIMTSRRVNPPHATKHSQINKALEEKELFPKLRFYEYGCHQLIFCLSDVNLKDKYQKDKSGEANSQNPEEEAHVTDAYDYGFVEILGSGGGGGGIGGAV